MISKIKAMVCVLVCLVCTNITDVRASFEITAESTFGTIFDDFLDSLGQNIGGEVSSQISGQCVQSTENERIENERIKNFLRLVFDDTARGHLSKSAIKALDTMREAFRCHVVDRSHHFYKRNPKGNDSTSYNAVDKGRFVGHAFLEVMKKFIENKEFELKKVVNEEDGNDVSYYFVVAGTDVTINEGRYEKINVATASWHDDAINIAERGRESVEKKNLKVVSNVVFLFNPIGCYRNSDPYIGGTFFPVGGAAHK
jgi:hypothetical protein